MAKIFLKPAHALFSGGLTRSSPAYVQYYITARCNLRCQQCNIIYANADQTELSTSESLKVLDSLAEIGTSVVLLTGGEPFLRKDLPKLVQHAISVGIHPRLQTNGIATARQLEEVVEAGANDISISLDSLQPNIQDEINGGFDNSWYSAIETISNVSSIFPRDSFAALGCVLAPKNIKHVPSVIEFASQIGWWVSLVPAHSTAPNEPRGFSTFDSSVKFTDEEAELASTTVNRVKGLKRSGKNVYDSFQYLDDIGRYVRGERTTWRDRNGGACDAGTSYFAVTPNGEMAACCDFRLPSRMSLADSNFPKIFASGRPSLEANQVAKSCSGCMYGSYPEITISTRFAHAAGERFLSLFAGQRNNLVPMSAGELMELATTLRSFDG